MQNFEDFIQGRFGDGLGSRILADGKSLNELFVVEGIPLFWFYKRYLLKHVLPRPLNSFKSLAAGRKLSLFQKSMLSASSYALKKYFLIRELRKTRAAVENSQYSSSRKAIFLTYPDHLREENKLYRIQGIIDCFNRDKILEPFPLFVTQLSSSETISPDLRALHQYCDQEIISQAARQADILARRWLQLDKKKLDEAMSLEGVSLRPYLSPALSLFMSREFLSVILMYYGSCKKAIEKENAAIAFISGQNGLAERCLAAASKAQGIPCMLLPHGYAIGNMPARDVLDNMYIPVFNKTTASSFIASGVPERQIMVTGPAMYDNIAAYRKNRFPGKSKSFGKDKPVENSISGNNKLWNSEQGNNKLESKNILILTQPLIEDNFMSPDGYFSMIESVLAEIASIPEASISIKLHPREKRIARYKALAERMDTSMGASKISILQTGELNLLYSLLAKAKVVVNFYATAGILEASILDVPSITFPYDKKKSAKYGAFDPSLYVWEKESLRPAIEKLLKNPALLRRKRQEMVKEFCTFTDGKSSERVVQWAYEILNKKDL